MYSYDVMAGENTTLPLTGARSEAATAAAVVPLANNAINATAARRGRKRAALVREVLTAEDYRLVILRMSSSL